MFSDIGEKTVEAAQAAIREDLQKIDPLLTKLYMMANGLIQNAIDRFDININVQFRIKPNPGSNPAPD